MTPGLRLFAVLGLVFGASTACGKASKTSVISEPGDLGSIAELRSRAAEAGCTVISNSATPNGFACVKRVSPCGCELVLKVFAMPNGDRIASVKADLFGCPTDVGNAERRALLEPLVPPSRRDAFHEFTSKPRIERDTEQQQRYAAFQTAVFDDVHTRILFGIVNDVPRRTLWLDRHTPGNIQVLVPDAAAYASACVEPNVYASQVNRFGKAGADRLTALGEVSPLGYCSMPGKSQELCQLGEAVRTTAMEHIHSAITDASLSWVRAIAALRIDDKIKAGKLAFDTRLA